jgi:hypothetical protein
LTAAITAIVDAYTTGDYVNNVPLWALPLAGLGGSAANAGWTITPILDGPKGDTLFGAGALENANQFGPLTFNLGNHGTISLIVTPSETNPTGTQPVFNAGDIGSWTVGLADLIGSTGNTGWTANNTFGGGNGGIADVAGILSTANRLGPAVFNLNVLKALAFTQPPNGRVLENRQLDDIHAVDLGQWEAGIPGLITNTGTTGFIADWGYGNGLGTGYWTGGLQTTTQIGPLSFTLTVVPAISFDGTAPPGTNPFSFTPGISFSIGTGDQAAGAQAAPLAAARVQPSATPSKVSAPPTAAAIAPAAASLGTTTPSLVSAATKTSPAANGRQASPTQITGQTPAVTTSPLGAGPTTPSSAQESATVGTLPTAIDGLLGKHPSDNSASSTESGSGAADSGSTN